jgi:hypothetical protein
LETRLRLSEPIRNADFEPSVFKKCRVQSFA